MRVTITASAGEWAALLAVLPTCVACGTRAELLINGRLHCVTCGARERFARVESPAWTAAADAIDSALSPFEPSGRWQKDPAS